MEAIIAEATTKEAQDSLIAAFSLSVLLGPVSLIFFWTITHKFSKGAQVR